MKKIRILLITLILILAGAIFTKAYAANERTFGASLIRPFTNSKYQYRVPDNLLYTVVKLYDANDKNGSMQLYNKAIYCLRGGVGFGSQDVSSVPINYTELGEMHKNAQNVISKYQEYYNVNLNRDEEITFGDVTKSVNIYNALLWIIDEAYLPTDAQNYNAEEYKAELLCKAGIKKEQQNDITDDDIEVIQQLAIWFLANYDEQKSNIKPTVSQSTNFPANLLLINEENDWDEEGYRLNNLNKLYQYFIKGALNNAENYTNSESTGERTRIVEENKFDKTVELQINKVDENEPKPNVVHPEYHYYEIGPFKLEGDPRSTVNASDIVIYDANNNIVNKYYNIDETRVYKVFSVIDKTNPEEDLTELNKGMEYYIRVLQMFTNDSSITSDIPQESRYDLSKVTLRVSSTYEISTAKFLARNKNEQVLVEISKEKKSSGDEITIQEPKTFDLALRKFITKINGEKLTVSREPVVNISTLINGITDRTGKKQYTATYSHPKNALEVKEGDIVTYTIRIYNEGELDGTATEVTDYLPDGLKLVPNSKSVINQKYGWTTTDGKAIVSSYLKDKNIVAFNGSDLKYLDLEIECEVIAKNSESDNYLRNIAEITEDSGDDRDSTPKNVDKNSYNPPEDNSTYQEDDDDYEKLVLPAVTQITVNKVWNDNNNQDGKRAEYGVTLYANGTKYSEEVILSKDTLSYTWNNLPKCKEGKEIVYTVKETKIPTGYTVTYSKDTLTITNKYDPEKTQITVSKVWNDKDDQDGKRPTSVEVQLYKNGKAFGDKVILNKDNKWTTTWSGLDKKENGKEIEYTVDEVNVPEEYTKTVEKNENTYTITNTHKIFDLSLRKYIVAVNGEKLDGENSRIPDIDIEPLKQEATTAEYKHRKDPVAVETGDIVTYSLTIYNEGEKEGRATKIVDQLPTGLQFVRVVSGAFELDSYNEEDNKLVLKRKSENTDNLVAFDGSNLDKETIEIECKVIAYVTEDDKVLTNVAWIAEEYDAENETTITNQERKDRDSEPATVPSVNKDNMENYKGTTSETDLSKDIYYPGEQDDDDFEKLVIKGKAFDLSLRKFITSIKRNGEEVEFDDRTPKINTTTLIDGTYDRNGAFENTATYEHSKEPIVVKKGDIVTYTLRIYNEGERDGYASIVTDYIPEGLALINGYNTNDDNLWALDSELNYDTELMDLVGKNGFYKTEADVKNLKVEDFTDIESLKEVKLVTGKTKITTTLLNDELIKAFDKSKTLEEEGWQKASNGEGGLYYKDIQVSCLVIAENTCKDVLTNIAEISKYEDENKNIVEDRDSDPINVDTKNEDDDDYEPVILRYFDLALRKFITAVETNGKVTDITSRIPVPKLGEDGNIVYEHTKEPVKVGSNDIVTYTIRVFNEGTLAGYADEITDDIPEGLEFLPDNDTNKDYEWKMFDKDGNKTDKVEEAVKITTDYLSQNKESKSKMIVIDEETGEQKEPTNIRENILNSFDSEKDINSQNPSYRDVKVAFKVIEPNTSERVIVNSAQISADSGDDEDSIPDEWNEGEDDQDKEYIYVKYFDLSLLKWVTKTIVTVDNKTTTTSTGFKPNTGLTETKGIRENSEAEPIAKVEIDRKKINKTTVKFAYSIRVTNEGEIAGYATEITDYIPDGLEFIEADNTAFGWKKNGDNKVTSRALETVLLQPGESAELEIVFTWKNNTNNLGLKTNIAEISEDYNEYNSKDIDSTPNNKKDEYEKEQEDDDDFALVILSIKTGKEVSYTLLILSIVTVLAGGIYLIKKYVLAY